MALAWLGDPRLLVIQALTGVANAMFLFLIASGLSLIFGVSRILNFAHGSLYMLAAYLTFSLTSWLAVSPWSFWVALVAAPLFVALLGTLIEVALLRRIYGSPELYQLLLTFGLVLIAEDAVKYLWGTQNLSVPSPPQLAGSVSIFGQQFPAYYLLVIGVGPLAALGLWLLLYRTRWGILIRAATEDRAMVSALGVDQARLFTSVFALGSWLAGLGGTLAAPLVALNPAMDTAIIVEAFVVVVVGGMGSFAGALVSALLIGQFNAFGILVLPRLSLVLIFAFMALVLIVRPWGLFGRPLAEPEGRAAPWPPAAGPGRAMGWGLAGAALLLLPLLLPRYYSVLATEVLAFALFAASLNLLVGTAGLASFGHAAYFGIGAYVAALLMQKGGLSMPLAFALAPIGAAAAGALFGAFCVRLSQIYFAMLTLAFAQMAYAVVFQWYGFTGGDNGLLGIWPAEALGSPVRFYYFALAVTATCLGGLALIARSPFGAALRATRDSASRAEAIGLDVRRLRLLAFTLAAFFAGVAGALFVFQKGSAFPNYLFVTKSIEPLVMILLGGLAQFAGPLVGAAIYVGLETMATRFTEYWGAALGIALVALVILFPRGIMAYVSQGWARVWGQRAR